MAPLPLNSLVDHPVRFLEHRLWNRQPDGARSLQIHDGSVLPQWFQRDGCWILAMHDADCELRSVDAGIVVVTRDDRDGALLRLSAHESERG